MLKNLKNNTICWKNLPFQWLLYIIFNLYHLNIQLPYPSANTQSFSQFQQFSSKNLVYHVTSHTQSPSYDETLSPSSSFKSKRENDIALHIPELKKLLEVLEFKSHEEEKQLTKFLGPRNSLYERNSTPTYIKLQFSCGRRRKFNLGKELVF